MTNPTHSFSLHYRSNLATKNTFLKSYCAKMRPLNHSAPYVFCCPWKKTVVGPPFQGPKTPLGLHFFCALKWPINCNWTQNQNQNQRHSQRSTLNASLWLGVSDKGRLSGRAKINFKHFSENRSQNCNCNNQRQKQTQRQSSSQL